MRCQFIAKRILTKQGLRLIFIKLVNFSNAIAKRILTKQGLRR
ncbi:MAG: hypothetical protein ACRCVG_08335 [Methanobacteriaceae archaeon]